ncbi:hypothetical protein CRYUN_Cryun03dG0090000 [Craigia yunnanensis]
MVFIAVLIISFHTMLYLFNVFSITPLITDLIMKQTYQLALASPGSPDFTNLLIVEEKYGIEALAKAAQIVNGMKLRGFILNLLLTIVSSIFFQYLRLIMLKQSEAIRIVIAVLVVSSIWMVRMFWYTAYTVLYYRCKKTHGEEVELQATDMEYTKIPTAPLNNESIQ